MFTFELDIPLDQQRMIEELKYQQDQQVLHNQLSNLEVLKAQQVSFYHSRMNAGDSIVLDRNGRETAQTVSY